MTKAQITIQLGNEGMQSRQDIADAIHKVADEFLANGKLHLSIMDENGNKVGQMEIVRD